MVALSYPERFQLRSNATVANIPRPTNADVSRSNYDNCYRSPYRSNFDCDMYGSSIYGSRYGYMPYWMRYGYSNFGYGNGYYGSYYPGPIVVVPTNPSGGAAAPAGRAVRGQGYTQNRTSTSSSEPRSTSSTPYSTDKGGTSSSGSSSSGSSSGSSSSGGDGGRTARPKTPPPSI
jgi:hypothetical protein